MRKSIIVKKKCQVENKVTEHYHYPETDSTICASCRRQYRLNRYHNNENARKNDLRYNKSWKKKHPERVSEYASERKLKLQKIKFNFENAKKDFIVMNLTKLQSLYSTYGLTMHPHELMTAIGNINNTTVSKILMNVVKSCRLQALKKYSKSEVKRMDIQALDLL